MRMTEHDVATRTPNARRGPDRAEHDADDAGATPAVPILIHIIPEARPHVRSYNRIRIAHRRVTGEAGCLAARGDSHLALPLMNRIRNYLDEPPEPPELPHLGDYYVVAGDFGRMAVEADVARQIAAVLDSWRPRTWVEFRDRAGSRIRVRVRHIRSIIESTAVQRAADRRLERAQQDEEKADRRSWDDE
jgi:hypothetical protein